MTKQIWNQGRVVGFSAYEIYVKQHLTEDPTTPPATEREWLASSIALGTSMLLRVPDINQGESECRYLDVYLPKNSRLAAANTLVASFFEGDATFGSDNWATKITDYGTGISNTSASSPSGDVEATGTVPSGTIESWSLEKKKKLADYMHVYDGIVIQPGEWYDGGDNKPPEKDFAANLKNPCPRIRLMIKGPIKNKPLILFTGFTIRTVLAGVVGQDTVLDTQSPQDGDFLGPAVFPWASKIVFTVPSSYITFFASGGYRRDLKSPTAASSITVDKTIKDEPVIDMQGSKPETFYSSYSNYYKLFSYDSTNPRYGYNVRDFSSLGDVPTDGEAVLTVYQKKDIYPPALYGTFVSSTGTHYLNPLDCVAPGSVKILYDSDEDDLKDYQNTFPGTTAINKKPDGTLQILNVNNKLVDVAGIEISYAQNNGTTFNGVSGDDALTGTNRPKFVKIKTGQKSVLALMMSTNIADGYGLDPTQITMSPNPSSTITLNRTNSSNNISWSALLSALTQNRSIDILGNRLKSAKETLVRARNTDGPYLEFGPDSSPLRLYITDVAPDPSDAPIGSIGIGWGFTSKAN